MPLSANQRLPFDERPGAVNFLLAAWVGLMVVVVVSLRGFDAADPLRNGWVRLGGLALTAGLLALAFRTRTEGAARRLQLGVGASLVLHTLGAMGLANVSLRTQADPVAEPAPPPLVKKALEFQPRLAFAPREDAPPRPVFEQPLATSETPRPSSAAVERPFAPIAEDATLRLDPPPAPLPKAEPARFDLVEPNQESSPTVAAAAYEREGLEADLSTLTTEQVAEVGAEPAAANPQPEPILPRLKRGRNAVASVAPVTNSLAEAPVNAANADRLPPAVLSTMQDSDPVVAQAPRSPTVGHAQSTPLVDVAPLQFEAATPTRTTSLAAAPSVTRRRAPIEVTVTGPTGEPTPALASPAALTDTIGKGPTARTDSSSDQKTPLPGSRPQLAPAAPRNRRLAAPAGALAAAPPLPPRSRQPPFERATPAAGQSEIATTPTASAMTRTRTRPSVVAPLLAPSTIVGPLAPQALGEVASAARSSSVAVPPLITVRPPRVASLSRNVRVLPAPAGVPGGPMALPPRARATAPAFAARLRSSSTETPLADETKQQAAPARAAANSGAPPRTEAAIELGLQFLAASQRADGSWSFRDQVEPNGRAGSARAAGAATGLALLALLGAGCDHFGAQHGDAVQRGLDYLIDRQREDGLLFPELGSQADDAPLGDGVWSVARYYSHGIASIALCEAFGMTGDAKLRVPAQRALDYLEATQVERLGGWRYTPGVNTDLSVTGWQLMALRSGELAGLDVSPVVYDGVRRFVESCRERSGRRVRFCYNPGAPPNDPRISHGRRPGTVMTAVGLLSMLYLGDDPRAARMQLGANHLLDHLPTADPSSEGVRVARISTIGDPLRDTYYWYYATQVMYHMGGDYWRAWNDALHPLLVDTQVSEGDLAGSWNPYQPLPDRWSHFGGRHYVTTMNLLSLEVYYRHLPLYGRVEGD